MARTKIVVSLLTKEQEFQLLQAADAERAAAQADVDVEIVYAKNNATLQLEQLYRFVHAPEASRPAAIIAQTVGGDGLPRVARDAVKAGIGWILLNRDVPYIEQLRADNPRLPIAVVTTDQMEIGRIQASQLRSILPAGGQVLYLQGPADTSASSGRLRGAQEGLAGANVELHILNGDWTAASGEQALTAWLRLSSSQQQRLDAVAAQNDAMAMGARKAIEARRPDWAKLPFIGCDGVPENGQRLVDEGQLAATVVVPPSTGPAIGLLAAYLRNGAVPSPRLVLRPSPYTRRK